MRSGLKKGLALSAIVIAVCAAPTAVLAQEEDSASAPTPVVVVGDSRFQPVFEDVVLAPGERVHRVLNVGRFGRVSLLGVAESGPNDGRVTVVTAFGPPAVPVRNALDLVFDGGNSARRGDTLVVMGPKLHVEIVNRSRQPVRLTMSAFAKK